MTALELLARRVAASHNLRALVLRLADGDLVSGSWRPDDGSFRPDRCDDVDTEGLVEFMAAERYVRLTELGRVVAERVRPAKWTASMGFTGQFISRPSGVRILAGTLPSNDAQALDFLECQRIVDLLNADELARAKTYEVRV